MFVVFLHSGHKLKMFTLAVNIIPKLKMFLTKLGENACLSAV
jgi:hypothetical protein